VGPTEPVPPIFVFEGDDLSVHDSVEGAEGFLEPPDVREGIYVAFDSQGRVLTVELDGQRTVLTPAEDSPQQFEAKLRDYLRAVDEPKGSETGCDLPCLWSWLFPELEFSLHSKGYAAS